MEDYKLWRVAWNSGQGVVENIIVRAQRLEIDFGVLIFYSSSERIIRAIPADQWLDVMFQGHYINGVRQ